MSNLEGEKFGRLMVLELEEKKEDSHSYYTCRCSCGVFVKIRDAHLISGHTKSCGCLRLKTKKEKRDDSSAC